MQPRSNTLLPSLALAATLIAVGMPVDARTARQHQLNAASVCSAAVPADQRQFSVRPFGIYNAGPDSAYVSCNLPIEVISDVKTDAAATPATVGSHVWLGFKNFSATVSRKAICNVTGGGRWTGVATGSSQTVTLAGNGLGSLQWGDINRQTQFGSMNISCILAPGVELNEILVYEHDADDGL